MTIPVANRNLYTFKTRRTNVINELTSPYSLTPVSAKSQKLLRSPRKASRKISKIPFKVLDAPELQDDFYLNLVDWSAQNVLSVGLGSCVYLWSACTSQVTKLCDLTSDNDSVTSVSWSERGNFVAVGTGRGYVQVKNINNPFFDLDHLTRNHLLKEADFLEDLMPNATYVARVFDKLLKLHLRISLVLPKVQQDCRVSNI